MPPQSSAARFNPFRTNLRPHPKRLPTRIDYAALEALEVSDMSLWQRWYHCKRFLVDPTIYAHVQHRTALELPRAKISDYSSNR